MLILGVALRYQENDGPRLLAPRQVLRENVPRMLSDPKDKTAQMLYAKAIDQHPDVMQDHRSTHVNQSNKRSPEARLCRPARQRNKFCG